MLDAYSLLILVLFALVIWLWRNNLAARERAVEAAGRTCRETGVQMLDQTVAITRLGLGWSASGLRLRRRYRFEFSTDGSDRHPGRVELFGLTIIAVHLDGPSGLIVS